MTWEYSLGCPSLHWRFHLCVNGRVTDLESLLLHGQMLEGSG